MILAIFGVSKYRDLDDAIRGSIRSESWLHPWSSVSIRTIFGDAEFVPIGSVKASIAINLVKYRLIMSAC